MPQQFTYKKLKLNTNLNSLVNYAWWMEDNLGNQKLPDLLIPDGYAEVIFIFRGGYQKQYLDKSNVQLIQKSVLIGIQNKSCVARRIGKVRMVGIKFKPVGFYQFFKNEAPQLFNQSLELSKVENLIWKNLEKKLKATSHPMAAEAALNLFFEKNKPPQHAGKSLEILTNFLNDIILAKGNIQLENLAQKHGISLRQIQRYFKSHLGIAPKKWSNVIRFKAWYKENLLDNNQWNHFLDYGYFDQNHFIKAFKTNLGITPSQLSDLVFQQKNQIAKMSYQP